MAIPKSFIAQLLLHCSMEEIASRYVQVKLGGRNKKAICPFHSEKTPSMVIYPETQSFYCFGCGAAGDVISFIMRIENLSYPQAVHFLAQMVGLSVPDDAQEDAAQKQRARILEINREAARFFHQTLKSEQGKHGLAYFRQRQISDAILVKYGLGFAPDSWTSLRDALKKKGFSYEDMEAARVVVKGKSQNYYDQFRGRVIFPIIDHYAQVIGFGGRVLDDSKPKYLNSSDSMVFKKSRNLFSLNFAKTTKQKRLILTEGYMDTIALHDAGFDGAIATLGTALTQEQARLLRKYTDEVVVAYDSDEAGQKASLRAKNRLSEVGIAVKIISFAGAKDPDEYIKKFGVKRFSLLLDEAEDMLAFELKKLQAQFDLTKPDQKTVYIKAACSLLAGVANDIERDVYAGTLAKQTEIAYDSVRSIIASMRKNYAKKRQEQQWHDAKSNRQTPADRGTPEQLRFLAAYKAEQSIIGQILRNPDYIPLFRGKILPDGFVTPFHAKVMSSILSLYEVQEQVTLSDLTSEFTLEQHSSIAKMMAKEAELTSSENYFTDLIDTLQREKQKSIQSYTNMTPEEIPSRFHNKR